MDKFTNNLGIVICAVAAVLTIGWIQGRRNEIAQHLNAVSELRLGIVWQACVFIITPAVLLFFLVEEIRTLLSEGYEGYESSTIFAYGWLVLILIAFGAVLWTFIPFRGNQILDGLPSSDYGVPPNGRPRGVPNPLSTGAATSSVTTPASTPTEGNEL